MLPLRKGDFPASRDDLQAALREGLAQAFRLPAGGGKLDITRDQAGREVMVTVEAVLLVVVTALALPGAPDAGEAGDVSRIRRTGHVADASARGRGRDRTAPARRGSRGARPRGRRRRSVEGAESSGPGRVLAAAGHLPARGGRVLPRPPQDLALPGRPAGRGDRVPPDQAAADDDDAAGDSFAARDDAAETGWVPGERAGRVQEADW